MENDKNTVMRDFAELRRLPEDKNPADIAEKIENLDSIQAVRLFRMLPKNTAAEVFAYLDRDVQQNIITAIKDSEMRYIIDELRLDDAVDFIEEMPAGVVKRVLSNLPREKREMINLFLNYPQDSAGSIMTIEYVDLKENISVAETFERIRNNGVNKETIYNCYVIDSERHLLGMVTVKDLLFASPDEKIGAIMTRDVKYATTTDDVENVTNEFKKYGLLAMPVVDNEKRLVGIITVDDVLDVQEEEATEDFEIMAAISPSDEPYMKTSVWKLARNRIPWLLIMMVTATVTGTIMTTFEYAIHTVPLLIAFIPMLMDTAGNSGAQSSTLIIRGIALEDITKRDIFRVLWKELRVGFLCGFCLSVVNFIRVLIFYHDNPDIWILCITITLTLWATVIIAKTVGCMLPQLAKRAGLDPAVMASPMITTIVDACALMVFFGIATTMFNIQVVH